ncbi:MAG: class I SAM-dependent methyltransferase [Collinsella sp.]
MKLLALSPVRSVLDMGCGAGSIAIPLAQAGHSVIAADFPLPCWAHLMPALSTVGSRSITPLELAWDDDWYLVGPVAKAVDVAFASRSVTTTNLKGALAKLDRNGRRRCAVTMVANSSPRYDLHLMNAIGASVTCSNGFVYAFNILIQMGALPQVTYFESPRRDTFNTLEAEWRIFPHARAWQRG